MPLLLGLDAGTTSFKAALFDERGRLVARASEEYTLATPGPDRVEFAPEEYWRICCRVTRAVVQRSGSDPMAVAAMAVSSQGETLVCVDARGEAVGNAIVWLDNRSRPEAEILTAELGTQRAYEVTGQPEIVATWPATKILWLRRNAPSLFERTARFLLLEDYLLLRLTGVYAGERSLHSSTMLLDIRTGSAWTEMLDLLRIDETRLPPLFDSGAAVGRVSDRACDETGLWAGTLVVTGALDQAAGMVGSGNIRKGLVTESTGTCLAVCVNTGDRLATPAGSRIPQHYGVLPGTYYSILWSPTAGIVLKWFRDTFYRSEAPRLDGLYDEMIAEAARIPPGSDGLLLLPHLSGSAFPDFDNDARGMWSGIALTHTRGHFVRSILEAVAFLLRQAVDAIEAQGVPVTEIRSIGGGSGSALWSSIKADVTGKRILPIDDPEPACFGAALLAGVGAGVFSSLESACDGLTVAGTPVLPATETTPVYRLAFQRFLALSRRARTTDNGEPG
jgi:xylulokinase